MASKKTTVLVVDDDVRLLRMMERILDLEGYRVIKATDGQIAMAVFEEQKPDLVMLDVMMPGMDGLTVCKRIREYSFVPIIMVTAKGNDAEKVEGLDAGADDYIAKPFSPKELAARVKATLRRAVFSDEPQEPPFECQGLTIDYSRHRVALDDQEIDLTVTEYRLLSFLAGNAGRILTPDQILSAIWGDDYCGEYDVLRMHMTRLRRKLGEDGAHPKFIVTVHGIGYMLETDHGQE